LINKYLPHSTPILFIALLLFAVLIFYSIYSGREIKLGIITLGSGSKSDFAKILYPNKKLDNSENLNQPDSLGNPNSKITGKWVGDGEDVNLSEILGENAKPKYRYKCDTSIEFVNDRITFKGVINTSGINSHFAETLDFNAVGFMFNGKANITYTVVGNTIFGTGVMNVKFSNRGTLEAYFISDRVTGDGRGFGKLELKKAD
jgi:hypothetical protein